MKFICFDLEGPLAPQDNAYELMKSFPSGDSLFEVISRYDDILTLEKRPDYEPGDTLSLIVPFLVHHDVTERDIKALADKAPLTPGAADLLDYLHSQQWRTFCASTSYEQYALNITRRLNIPATRVACTRFPLDRFRSMLVAEDIETLDKVEEEFLRLDLHSDDAKIKETLDKLFSEKIALTNFGRVMRTVKPVGGSRKVRALEQFGRKYRAALKDWVAVGDSITDGRMLETVDRAGGLAIAFNANEYALPYATVGVASLSLFDLKPVLDAWDRGGRALVESTVKEKERAVGKDNRENYQWLAGRPVPENVLQLHRATRRLVRQDAARLG